MSIEDDIGVNKTKETNKQFDLRKCIFCKVNNISNKPEKTKVRKTISIFFQIYFTLWLDIDRQLNSYKLSY